MSTTTNVLSDLHHEVRGSGPAVLFISGASGDARHFARIAERLADEFTTVAYDRRGCSRSARLPGGAVMSIGAQADDAAALLEELGLAPAIVFGTSGGGDIALELVARPPEIVRGAIVHEPALVALAGEAEAGEGAHARQRRSLLLPGARGVRRLRSGHGEDPGQRRAPAGARKPGRHAAADPGHGAPRGDLRLAVEPIAGHHAPYL